MSLIKSYLKKSMPVCHINPVRVLFGIKEVRTGFLGKYSSSLNVLYIFFAASSYEVGLWNSEIMRIDISHRCSFTVSFKLIK